MAVRNPDPARFRKRALGRPSAVRVLGLTLAVAPVQMRVESDEVGQYICRATRSPAFTIALRNATAEVRQTRVEAVVTDYYGEESRTRENLRLGASGGPTPCASNCRRKSAVISRRSSTCSTAPQTRCCNAIRPLHSYPKTGARRPMPDSPFGTWCFGTGHRGTTVDRAGPLMYKAGIRRTSGRVRLCGPQKIRPDARPAQQHSSARTKSVKAIWKLCAGPSPSGPTRAQALVFHESNIGPQKTPIQVLS